MNKLFILCMIAMLSMSVMSRRQRRMQAVVQPAASTSGSASASGSTSANTSASADTGASSTASEAADSAASNAGNPAGHSLFSQYTWSRWVFGIIYIVIGLPLCFMGLHWWKWNCFPFAGLFGFIGGLTIIDLAAGGSVSESWMWAGLAIALGVTVALILVFFFCKHITGGLMGAALGFIAYSFFEVNYRTMSGQSASWWAYIVLAALVAGGIVFGCCCSKDMIMITTAIYGGWVFVSGVGTMTAQFPHPEVGVEGWVTWCYIIAAIAFCVIGFFFQCIHKQRTDKKEAEATTEVQGGVTIQAEIRV